MATEKYNGVELTRVMVPDDSRICEGCYYNRPGKAMDCVRKAKSITRTPCEMGEGLMGKYDYIWVPLKVARLMKQCKPRR